MVAIVKRVDQILCKMESVGDANKLHYLFSNILGLPEAWPPTDKKTYYGGGVYAGNTWLKWVTLNTKNHKMTNEPASFIQFGLEPNGYEHCLKQLEKRKMVVKDGGIQTTADSLGQEQEWCRTYSPADSPFKEVWLFMAKYTPYAFNLLTTTPEAKDVDEHRRIMEKRFNEVNGGLLGVRYLKEIELGVKDLKQDAREWQRLLDPIKPKGGSWKIGKGPALKLTVDKDYSIKRISFKVKSLRVARKVLKMHGLLGDVDEGVVRLDKGRVNGLDIRFIK